MYWNVGMRLLIYLVELVGWLGISHLLQSLASVFRSEVVISYGSTKIHAISTNYTLVQGFYIYICTNIYKSYSARMLSIRTC